MVKMRYCPKRSENGSEALYSENLRIEMLFVVIDQLYEIIT